MLSHAKALLKSAPQGACAYLDADLRHPEEILAAAADTLDFSQPVAVMLLTVLQFAGGEASAIVKHADGGVRAGQLRRRSRTRPATSTPSSTPRWSGG